MAASDNRGRRHCIDCGRLFIQCGTEAACVECTQPLFMPNRLYGRSFQLRRFDR